MSYLDFRKVPEPLEKRIEIARENLKLEPNCYGTAFFLFGILPYDMVVFTDKRHFVQKGLNILNKIEEPQDNSLMVSLKNGKEIKHMTYIKTANPFNAYQRRGSSGNFEFVENMEQIYDYLKSAYISHISHKIHWTHKYYSFTKLKKVNNQFHRKNINSWSKEIVNSYTPIWWG